MYIKFSPNQYVIRYQNGKVVREGIGLSFFFFEHATSAAAIPISTGDADFIFEETTADYQAITVQGQLTYKITDYAKISSSLDFSVNLKTKEYIADPMKKLSKRIINIAEVLVKSHIRTMQLTTALQASQELADQVFAELLKNEELCGLGVTVCGFSVLKIAANAETTRALEAKTREEILKNADDALYERRNASIEQERRIKENELNTDLSVEQKKKAIKESEIATKKMVLEKENELAEIKVANESRLARMKSEHENELRRLQAQNDVLLEEKRKELTELRLANAKKEAEAEAYRIASVMEAYGKLSPDVLVALATLNMEPEKLIAQAFQQLAVNSEKIGQLNITPDLLESVMKRNDQ